MTRVSTDLPDSDRQELDTPISGSGYSDYAEGYSGSSFTPDPEPSRGSSSRVGSTCGSSSRGGFNRMDSTRAKTRAQWKMYPKKSRKNSPKVSKGMGPYGVMDGVMDGGMCGVMDGGMGCVIDGVLDGVLDSNPNLEVENTHPSKSRKRKKLAASGFPLNFNPTAIITIPPEDDIDELAAEWRNDPHDLDTLIDEDEMVIEGLLRGNVQGKALVASEVVRDSQFVSRMMTSARGRATMGVCGYSEEDEDEDEDEDDE